MRCVHMGSTNKMIARTLGISEGTVKIHLASIFQQLGAPNRAAAVALYNGWLSAQLEVLRSDQNGPARPVMGEPGVVPLRRRKPAQFTTRCRPTTPRTACRWPQNPSFHLAIPSPTNRPDAHRQGHLRSLI